MTSHLRPPFRLKLGSGTLDLGSRTMLMGIINVTPDSFSDGGRFFEFDSALRQARELIAGGADILDVGGESTRPYSEPAPVDEELRRVIPLIEAVRRESAIPISIDTTKAEVAREAIQAGADIINDVSSLHFDDSMAEVAARCGAPVILMHMQGTPRIMQEAPSYTSLFSEIIAFLEERIQYAVNRGVSREQIIVDPGIGFGKTVSHNLQLIQRLELFHCLNRPVLLGASRKRFIGTILDRDVTERETGTAVVHSFAIAAGVHILRVHDVALHRQVALMGDAIARASC